MFTLIGAILATVFDHIPFMSTPRHPFVISSLLTAVLQCSRSSASFFKAVNLANRYPPGIVRLKGRLHKRITPYEISYLKFPPLPNYIQQARFRFLSGNFFIRS